MDWTLAITRNRDALLSVVAVLFGMAGLARGGVLETLPRSLRRAILHVLRPAESAVRRLIVIQAQVLTEAGISVSPRMALAPQTAIPRGANQATAFPLFDPRKRFTAGASPRLIGAGPRLSIPGLDDPVFVAEPSPDEPVNAERLCHRMLTLQRVLDELPRQARRLMRWRARQDRATAKRLSPMRPGWPPGYRKRQRHPVDLLLSDCHALAVYALEPP